MRPSISQKPKPPRLGGGKQRPTSSPTDISEAPFLNAFHHTTESGVMHPKTALKFDLSAIKMTAGLCAALLLLILSPEPSLGQSPSDQAGPVASQGGLSYSTASPTGGFNDALGRRAQGVDLYLGTRISSLPLYLGVDLDVGRYGSKKKTVDFPGVDGTFETKSFLYQPHLSARYQSATGRLRPFVEGLIGANVLKTRTTWSDFGTTVDAPESADETSVAFSAGAGIGLDLRLLRVKPLGVLGLTGSFHYIYGSEADVPVAEGVALSDDQVTTVTTNTSVLQPEIGLYFEL